jgi:hypothetical protein
MRKPLRRHACHLHIGWPAALIVSISERNFRGELVAFGLPAVAVSKMLRQLTSEQPLATNALRPTATVL